jgi:hypothetical protein
MEKRIYISNDIIQLTIKISRTLQRDKENTYTLERVGDKRGGKLHRPVGFNCDFYSWFVVGKK